MIKKHDFVDRTVYLIRTELEKHLPKEGTLDEMIDLRDKLIKKILK